MTNKILLLGFASLTLAACKKKDGAPQNRPNPVSTVLVEQNNVEGHTDFPTSIEGRVNNQIRAKIQGYITQVLVDEGQYVTKGTPLFRLETNMLNESALAARAGVGAARSSVAAAEANVNAAQAAVAAAKVEVDKLRPLVQKNIISNVQLQTAEANLAAAQAQLAQANAARQQASAGVSQAQANYQGVQENINYSIIRAPISGVVGKINFRNGSLVGPSDQTPITTVSDTSELYAYFSMNESEYLNFLKTARGASNQERLKNMPNVDLVLANGDVYGHKGRIEAVTGQIDQTTGTIQFRVSFPNPEGILSNGNTGTIRVPKHYDNVLTVPESATYEQQGLVYVYKVSKDTANNVAVKIIDRVNNLALIESGIKVGDTVVAKGVGNLRPGTAVQGKVVKTETVIEEIKPVFK